MKIEKLTPEQEALIPVVRDEWIKFCLGGDTSIDKKKTIEGIEWIYSLAKLEKPKFIAFADGPLAAQMIAQIFPNVCKAISINLDRQSVRQSVGQSVRQSVLQSVRQSVWQSVGESVGESVGQSVLQSVGQSVEQSVLQSVEQSVGESVRQSVEQSVLQSVEQSVRQSVRQSVWQSVGESVGESVRQSVLQSVGQSVGESVRQSVEQSVRQSVGQSVGESVEQSVLQSVEQSVRQSVRQSVWQSVGQFEYPYDGCGWAGYYAFYDFFDRIGIGMDNQKRLKEIIKTGVWEFLWFKDLCIVACRPSEINKNVRGQLHSTKGPAAKWPSGEVYWSLNGVKVNEGIVMHPEKLTKKEILGEKNVDVRREMIRQIGMERFCALAKPKILDKQGDYELLSIDLSDTLKDCRYLSMLNPSIKVRHIEGVERECETVEQAINWRAGDIKKSWKPIKLT